MSKKYRVIIAEIADDGGDEPTGIYEQIVGSLNIKKVIEAVNADADLQLDLFPKRKRAPRSDRGKKRQQTVAEFAAEREDQIPAV